MRVQRGIRGLSMRGIAGLGCVTAARRRTVSTALWRHAIVGLLWWHVEVPSELLLLRRVLVVGLAHGRHVRALGGAEALVGHESSGAGAAKRSEGSRGRTVVQR